MSENNPAGGQFESILRNFEYSIQGYRLFLDQLHGPLEEFYQEEQSTRINQILDKLELQEKRSVATGLEALVAGFRLHADEETANDGEVNGPARSESSATVEFSGRSHRAFMEITQLIMRTGWTGPKAQLERLYRSVIIGLVGQFEVLIADVAHQFFKRAPRALNAEDKVLTLSDLQQFGSVDVALDYLVEREIDELLSRSTEGWAEFFKQRMNIQLPTMARDWDIFKEVIQRRHIIVHADGRISRRYLQNVSPTLVKEYFGDGKIGQATRLDRGYVERALDHFEILGTLLCCTAWVTLDKESLPQFEDTLAGWIYDRLREGRWEMALAMAQEGENSPRLSHSTRIMCQLNAWLCLKQTGRFDEVKDDAEEFDDSALEQRFRLVRLAILDREEQFFDLLESSEGGGLDHRAWHEWPVFSEIRENPRFAELAERFAPEKKSTVADDSAGKTAQDESTNA